MKNDVIIAVDPDVDKSGVAVLDVRSKVVHVASLTFPGLMDFLASERDDCMASGKLLVVVVEAGWLNTSHWHLAAKDSARMAAAKGNAAGRNHETGRKIVEMARHYGLTVDEVKPLRKCWRGKDGKITHGELALQLSRRGITGLGKTSCQDARDAAWLAVVYSNL